jgi:hypothetical protein
MFLFDFLPAELRDLLITYLDAKCLSICEVCCSGWKKDLQGMANCIHEQLWASHGGLSTSLCLDHKEANKLHYSMLNSPSASVLHSRYLHDDKIVGLCRHSDSSLYSAGFSASACAYSPAEDLVEYLTLGTSPSVHWSRSIELSAYTSCVLAKDDRGGDLFVAGTKTGSLVLFPIACPRNSVQLKLSESHIRSMCVAGEENQYVFVGDGSGIVRCLRFFWRNDLPSHRIGVVSRWELDVKNTDSFNLTVTCISSFGDRVVACTKMNGLYVWHRDRPLDGSMSPWTLVKHIDHPRFHDRHATCVKFVTQGICVVGTRGASFTGENSRILKMLKDECCFAIDLDSSINKRCVNVLWSLPISRTILSVLPFTKDLILFSIDMCGIQIWDVQRKIKVNVVEVYDEAKQKILNCRNLLVCSGGFMTTAGGKIVTIEWINKSAGGKKHITQGKRK